MFFSFATSYPYSVDPTNCIHISTFNLLCPFALYYVPNWFMPHFKISRIFCREWGIKSVSVVLSAIAGYNVNTLYFNARSFPEKSAKTGNLSTIKTQCPSQLSCIHLRWSLMWRWRRFKIVGSWDRIQIKTCMVYGTLSRSWLHPPLIVPQGSTPTHLPWTSLLQNLS
jgi:hypothetical protein